MKFVTPNLHKGNNTTIRRGKWLTVAKVGDPLCLTDMENNVLGFGIINKICRTTLSEITQKDLDELACFLTTKTMGCLQETLHRIYHNFNPDDIAVISFTPMNPPEQYDIIDYGRDLTNDGKCAMMGVWKS